MPYKYPYTNLHELNLDLVFEEMKEIRENMGTNNYEDMKNKPKINGAELIGDKTGAELGLADHAEIEAKQDKLTAGANISIIGDTISATDTTYTAGENVQITGNVISAKDTKYTAGANISIDEETGVISASGTIAGLSANRGLSLDQNNAVGHSNSLTGGTKGNATKVPKINYDNYGHITSISEIAMYPPTTAGDSGQYWESQGTGAGVWKNHGTVTAGNAELVDGGTVHSALSGKIDTAGDGLEKNGTTIKHEDTIQAGTAGGANKAIKVTYNSTGHITETEEADIYAPTTAGNAGEVWTSTGAGGAWSAPTAGSAELFNGAFAENAQRTFNIAGKNLLIMSFTLPARVDEGSTVSENNWNTWIIGTSELTAKKYYGCYIGGAGPYRVSLEKTGNSLTVKREGTAEITFKLFAM